MTRKPRYLKEKQDVLEAIESGNLPYRVFLRPGVKIKNLLKALYRLLRGMNIWHVGFTPDPDKDSVWIRRYRNG